MKKQFFIVAIALFLSLPISASAAVLQQFGGYVTFITPCTCIPGTFLIRYRPLYPLGSVLFKYNAVLLVPSTIRYLHQQFLIVPPPTAWHLGLFTPAPTGIPCLGVAPSCTPPMADGTIFYTGSSFPGYPLP